MNDDAQINWKERCFELLKENEILRAEVKRLCGEITRLSAEVEQLKEKLNTNSKNSSKPPSQDPFRPKKESKPSGRKQGGQPGHPGHRRVPTPLDQVSQVIDLRPSSCPNCASEQFFPAPISVDCRQVVELPQINPEVSQYNIYTCCCTKCGKHVKADVPPEAERGFGPRLMGFVTLLAGEGLLSKRKICTIIGHLGMKISLGRLCNIHRLAAALLEPVFMEVKEAVLSEESVNGDETSWFRYSKRCWIWIGASQRATFFQIEGFRSREAFRKVFGGFDNTLTTDRYGAYNGYAGKKQTCLAHIMRDFTKMSERGGVEGKVGALLLKELKQVFQFWQYFKEGKESRSWFQCVMQEPIALIQTLLKVGACQEEIGNKGRALCGDLLGRFSTLWTFVEQEGVEPTNNLAERGLRPLVILRRLSNGSQSDWGIHFTERVMTAACTIKQQAGNFFDYLTRMFFARLEGAPAPALL